jgi:hypothetical protein
MFGGTQVLAPFQVALGEGLPAASEQQSSVQTELASVAAYFYEGQLKPKATARQIGFAPTILPSRS